MNRSDSPLPASHEPAPGLYVHIPFCQGKCPYCDFVSLPCRRPPVSYLAALRQEARLLAAHAWCRRRRFASLFIGGGTPSLLPAGELAGLVTELRHCFSFVPEPEVTVEVNPGSVDMAFLTRLRRAGVNRLSIGVQALADRDLRALGRRHTVSQGLAAVAAARQAGFANLNLDLIYGLPGQSLADWRRTLERAVAAAPEHIAAYELTVEPGTPFARLQARGSLELPSEEETAAMAGVCQELLGGQGYQRYEISNYARPGFQCRHNRLYWRNGSYLGLGAAAVSCLSGLRLRTVAGPGRYVRRLRQGRLPYQEAEALPLEARFRETVVMGLRQLAGVDNQELAARFGLTVAEYYGTTVERLAARGLVELNHQGLRLTEPGLRLANQVLAELV